MMGAKSRNKGADFEREVVAIAKRFGLHAERQAPLQANAATKAPDVVMQDVGRVECKRRARGFATLYEALGDADAVVFRDDRQNPMIAFDLADFLARFSER